MSLMKSLDIEQKIKDKVLKTDDSAKETSESKKILNSLEEKFGVYRLWLIEASGDEIGFVEVPKTVPIREGCIVRTTSKKFFKIVSPPIFDEYESGKRDYYVIKVFAERIEPLYE